MTRPRAGFPTRPFAAICGLAFVLLCEYEVARATTESLYLERHGSESLTEAWLAVALVMGATVAVYERLARRWPLRRLFLAGTLLSGAALPVVLWLGDRGVPGSTLALYVWKDVHVVLLLEMLWTHAALRFDLESARSSYGFILLAGSLGSLTGGLAVGVLAEAAGAEAALLAGGSLFVVLALGAPLIGRHRGDEAARREPRRMGDAVHVFRSSRYLQLLLVLIVLVQVVITLVDYQYNAVLESSHPDADERTAVIGRIYAGISVGAMLLQLGTGFILRRWGVPRTLFTVPALLGAGLVAFALAPHFALIAAAKVCSKTLDYSLFRAAKEVLYLPLSVSEKTHGKAIVDMFGYRVAKGGASLLLMGAISLVGTGLPITMLGLGLVGAWMVVTVALTRDHARRLRAAEVSVASPSRST